jgi:hypothetical protein
VLRCGRGPGLGWSTWSSVSGHVQRSTLRLACKCIQGVGHHGAQQLWDCWVLKMGRAVRWIRGGRKAGVGAHGDLARARTCATQHCVTGMQMHTRRWTPRQAAAVGVLGPADGKRCVLWVGRKAGAHGGQGPADGKRCVLGWGARLGRMEIWVLQMGSALRWVGGGAQG